MTVKILVHEEAVAPGRESYVAEIGPSIPSEGVKGRLVSLTHGEISESHRAGIPVIDESSSQRIAGPGHTTRRTGMRDKTPTHAEIRPRSGMAAKSDAIDGYRRRRSSRIHGHGVIGLNTGRDGCGADAGVGVAGPGVASPGAGLRVASHQCRAGGQSESALLPGASQFVFRIRIHSSDEFGWFVLMS